jgi:hypothetical protein
VPHFRQYSKVFLLENFILFQKNGEMCKELTIMWCFNLKKSEQAISSAVKTLTLNMKVRKCDLSNAEHRWNHTEMLVFSSTAPLYFKCMQESLFKK